MKIFYSNSEEAGDDILDGDGHASAKRVTPGYYETLDSLKQRYCKFFICVMFGYGR